MKRPIQFFPLDEGGGASGGTKMKRKEAERRRKKAIAKAKMKHTSGAGGTRGPKSSA